MGPTTADQDPLAAVSKGISLRGLRRLASTLRRFFGEAWSTVSTAQVNTDFVQAVTAHARCRLAELPSVVDPRDVGVPRYFISHAWKNSFALLLAGIEGFLESADAETRVWVDIIAVNQHADSGHQAADVGAFKDVVAAASGGTLVVMDLSSCNPATRAWCVYEWAHTLASHGPDGLHMPLGPSERAQLVASLDVAAAECFNPADKVMILNDVVATAGSVSEFNEKLRLQLLLQPLSYRVDLRRLGTRAMARAAAGMETGGSEEGAQDAARTQAPSWEWDWSRVEAWLQAGAATAAGGEEGNPSPRSRALCVLAGPGEGKSTVSAALCEPQLQPPALPLARGAEEAEENGSGTGTGGGGLAAPGCVIAHHFIKYSDQRRLDPMRALASLVFQMAVRLPRFRRHVLSADVTSLVSLADPEAAFAALMRAPLEKSLREDGTDSESGAGDGSDRAEALPDQIILLLDALDEADPAPAPALPAGDAGATGGAATAPSEGPAAVVSGVGDPSARPRPPSAAPVCGNKLFQLLANQLKALPPRVRFILTTRPDGLGGGVRGALERLFGPGGVEYVTPLQLRKSRGAVGADGGGGDGGGDAAEGCGAQLALGPQAITSMLADSWEGGTASVAGVAEGGEGAAGGGGVLVYHTVITECFRSCGGAPPPPLPPLTGTPRLPDLYGAYGAVFDAGMAALQAVATVVVPHGSAASSPPAAAAVRRLLCVLLAAQEPLPESLLSSMGFSHRLLAALPGWPVTFYLEEHRAYMLHKSLADWLADSRVSGPHAVDLRSGHRRLARRLLVAVNRAAAAATAADAAGGGVGRTASSMPPYALRYLVRHLVAAGQWIELARLVLRNHAFLAAVFGQRHGHELLRDLQAAPKALAATLAATTAVATTTTTTAAAAAASEISDALRWLLGQQHSLVDAAGAADVTANALQCPVGTAPFRAAQEAVLQAAAKAAPGRPRWRLRHALGAPAGWPQMRATLSGHSRPAVSLAWSPDGATLASADEGGGLRLWEGGSGECIAELKGHTDAVRVLAWSLDGRTLASGGSDCTVRLWDTATGGCIAVLKEHKRAVSVVDWSPDGATLVTGAASEGLRLWDVSAGQLGASARTLPAQNVKCAAWSSDGRLIACGCTDSKVRLYDVKDGKCTIKLEDLPGEVVALAWSRDGQRLAAGLSGKAVRTWAWLPGRKPGQEPYLQGWQSLDYPRAVERLAWSPDGAVLAVCCRDREVHLWHCKRVAKLPSLKDPAANISQLAWSSEGTLATGGSYDGSLRLWDTVAVLAASPKPQQQQASEAQGHTGYVSCVAWSPDGKHLASSGHDKALRLWNPVSGACTATLQGHSSCVWCVAWAPCGRQLASGGEDGCLLIWALPATAGARGTPLKGHSDDVLSVAWRPDGGELASCGRDLTVRLWDPATGACTAVLEGHSRDVTALAWSPDGASLVSASQDASLRIWDTVSRTCTAVLKGHSDFVSSVSWSPDGRCLASGSGDKSVRLYEMLDREEV
ncbi:hypothetical protein GPECTOR_6g762 [Gonium pectorale]|uniref:Uncharacterized protein n=1 Tax=Gonium pectorale TaxID=33097 RepID=A0A150GVM1_GONPE|nr:hypothetical protein GPECTOR_6g762 [Gonium pectorale]|eukprot:KXZ53844.1 hypothetical protein GPECTOR_6g762 [Gonium pectorale]